MKRSAGFTLLEIMAALAITGIIVVQAGMFIDERTQDVKDANTAQYQSMFNSAALNYIKSINTTITVAHTQSSPFVITFTDIANAGFIPRAYQTASTNPYQQTPCVVAYRGATNEIVAEVVTEGGQVIPTKRLPRLAAMIGTEGGWISPLTPTQATGLYNKWNFPLPTGFNCSGTDTAPGRVASLLYYDTTSSSNDYLYRNEIPGHPELNKMSAPLIIDSEKTENDDCSAYGKGALARAADGKLLSCSGSPLTFKKITSSF